MRTYPKTWLNPKIDVVRSGIDGRGLVVTASLKAGETVVIWGDGYTDRKGAEQARADGRGTMQWAEDIFSTELDDSFDDGPYCINHSCQPNTWMEDAFTIVAMRGIRKGEEITMDYVLFWDAPDEQVSDWKCNCGSPSCRGQVTGKDWRDPTLQERYQEHFSPLIAKRIANLEFRSR